MKMREINLELFFLEKRKQGIYNIINKFMIIMRTRKKPRGKFKTVKVNHI